MWTIREMMNQCCIRTIGKTTGYYHIRADHASWFWTGRMLAEQAIGPLRELDSNDQSEFLDDFVDSISISVAQESPVHFLRSLVRCWCCNHQSIILSHRLHSDFLFIILRYVFCGLSNGLHFIDLPPHWPLDVASCGLFEGYHC